MQNSDYFSRLIYINEAGPNMPSVEGGSSISLWFCSSCQKDHDSERSADQCCGMFDSYLEHFCIECNQKHFIEEEAKECCSRVTVPAICPICMIRADSHEDAIECCLHTHPNLTKAGMERMLIDVKNGKSWSEALAANAHY